MKAILMSIKPEYGYKILHGEKTVELRKTVPRDLEFMHGKGGRLVYLYFTGTGMVLGCFYLDYDVEVGPLGDLKRLAKAAALSMDELIAYGTGRDGAYHGWKVKEPGTFVTPIPLSAFGLKRPPQSWCYVEAL